jgi:hypothetical protein
MKDELQLLQNAASDLNLTVCRYHKQDRRFTTSLFFIQNSKGSNISPILDYEGLNNWLLGYRRALKEIQVSQ